jgi:hypothetical protein
MGNIRYKERYQVVFFAEIEMYETLIQSGRQNNQAAGGPRAGTG